MVTGKENGHQKLVTGKKNGHQKLVTGKKNGHQKLVTGKHLISPFFLLWLQELHQFGPDDDQCLPVVISLYSFQWPMTI